MVALEASDDLPAVPGDEEDMVLRGVEVGEVVEDFGALFVEGAVGGGPAGDDHVGQHDDEWLEVEGC